MPAAVGVGAWGAALGKLHQMGTRAAGLAPAAAIGLIAFLLFFAGGTLVRSIVRRVALRRKRRRNLAVVLGRLAYGAMFVLGILVAAVIAFPGFTPAALLQLLGYGGVALGFVFRDLLQNYVAGILLLLSEPFRMNDQIVFDKYEGTVEDVQMRATLMRTYDGRRVVIPNTDLFTSAVVVNTAFPHRRLEYDFGIGYGDDVERARDIMIATARGVEGVLGEPAPDVLAVKLAESTFDLRLRWWIEPPRNENALDARDSVIRAVKRALVENGIDLPFPTRTVLLHDQTEETDGDRRRQREGWPAGKADVPRPRAALRAAVMQAEPEKAEVP